MATRKPSTVNWLKKILSSVIIWRRCMLSRRIAKKIQRHLIAERGFSVVDHQTVRKIKRYCRVTFGTSSYWPWLATYTELRGEYREGWVPEDFFIYRILPRINAIETAHLSVHKTMDYRLFGNACIRPVLLVLDQLIYDPDFNLVDLARAYELLNRHGDEVIIKKDGYSGGYKTRFAFPQDIRLQEMLGTGKFVIQPVVGQHACMAEVYSTSVNSLRVLTYLDSHSMVSVKSVIMVFGAGGSRLSNLAQGGRYLFLDDDGKPFTRAFVFVNEVRKTEEIHPDTGFEYKNICIPFIKEVNELCVASHYQYPYTGYIGWDVYIDEAGRPKILEWNARLPVFYDSEAIAGPGFDTGELKSRLKD